MVKSYSSNKKINSWLITFKIYKEGTRQFTIVNDTSANIRKKINDYGFLIYPNPSNRSITIEIAKNTNGSILEIFNTLGELVLQRKFNVVKEIIDISGFDPGVYKCKMGHNNIPFQKN